jgi:hypothetical protein
MIINCDQCGKEFDKRKSNINQSRRRGHNIYCSKACANLGLISSTVEPCGYCGKTVISSKSRKAKAKTGHVFCNSSCAAFWQNKNLGSPRLKNGIATYRRIAIENQGDMCVVCGYDKVTQVHHIDKNRDNNDISNLVVLCPNHHAEVHRGLLDIKNVISQIDNNSSLSQDFSSHARVA